MLQPICWLLLVALLILVAIYVAKTLWKERAVEDGAQMPSGKRRILTLYLVTFGTGLVFMLVSLTSLDFPKTPVIPLSAEASSPTPTPTPGSTTVATTTAAPTVTPTPEGAPILLRVFPQIKGETTTTPRLAVYGKNFNKDSRVRFNTQRVPSDYLGDSLIAVPMESEYLVGRGSIMVDVVNGEAVSNAIAVPVERPQAQLNVFFYYRPWVTLETQLLLLVVFAGALGSYLHAIMSITEFIAARKLIASWFWWYLTRPFLGMAMGLVFYAVLRGGFLAGTPADANVVNPFGVVAIGALVGMFSDKAAQKLAEIFDVVFRSAQKRADKLEGANTGTSNADDAGTANAGDTGTANAGNTGTADAGNTGTADAGNTGTADAGNTGTADSGDTGTSNAGDAGTSNAGDTGTADAGNTGTADADDTGTADTG